MNDGANLTLAAVAALAVAGAVRRRGSRSNGPSLMPTEKAAIVRLVKTGDSARIDKARALSKALVGVFDLKGANLQGANLRGANLQGANLQSADLWNAKLNGADLQGANLIKANLTGADLEGANLQGANLQGAYLQGTNLRGADLLNAYLGEANLKGVEIKKVNIYYDDRTCWPTGFTPPPHRTKALP